MILYNIQFTAIRRLDDGTYWSSRESINHPRMLTEKGLVRVVRAKEKEFTIDGRSNLLRVDGMSHTPWSS